VVSPAPTSHADVEVNGRAVHVEVNGRAVRVSVAGLTINGEADRATLGGAQGCMVLEGNVHLAWGQDGHNARITAEHVVVHLKDGRVEVGPTPEGQGMTTNALQSCFSFWPSFAR
jgi:lipopolysaccharide export system protein LptA